MPEPQTTKAEKRDLLAAAFAKAGRPLPAALQPGFQPPTATCPTCHGVGRVPEGLAPAAPATNRPR